jgi:hypothetical protein
MSNHKWDGMTIQEMAKRGARAKWKGKSKQERCKIMEKVTRARLAKQAGKK